MGIRQGPVIGVGTLHVDLIGPALLEGHLEPVTVALVVDLARCRCTQLYRAAGSGVGTVGVRNVRHVGHRQRVGPGVEG